MKKIGVILLAVVLLFTSVAGLVGCNDNGGGSGSDYVEPSTEGENYQWIDDSAPMVQFGEPAQQIIYLDIQERTVSDDLRQLISSLKALVNGKEVRLFTFEGSHDAAKVWLDELGYRDAGRVTDYTDAWAVVDLFKDEFHDVVIYDPANMYTLDLACTYAGIHDALAISYSMFAQLRARGYDVEIVEDYRGDFADKYEVYEYMYDNLWNQCTHRILISMHVDYVGFIRSFGMLVKAAFVYLDTNQSKDEELMAKFLDDMPAGESCVYGWYLSEGAGVEMGSRYGVWTYAADWLQNLEFYAHEEEIVELEYEETFTSLEDVKEDTVYVALVLSEGDNMSYNQNSCYTIVNDPNFGDYPISLSLSPTSAVMLPEILNYYYTKANASGGNIGFMTGPSGVGYCYTNSEVWTDMDSLRKFFETTNKYCKMAGIKCVNNWTAGGGWDNITLTEDMRTLMEESMPDILCVYDQKATLTPSYNGSTLIRGMEIAYVWDINTMASNFKTQIDLSVRETERYNEPSFVIMQGNPWAEGGSLSQFNTLVQEVEREYGDKVQFVRVDELAQAQIQWLTRNQQGA